MNRRLSYHPSFKKNQKRQNHFFVMDVEKQKRYVKSIYDDAERRIVRFETTDDEIPGKTGFKVRVRPSVTDDEAYDYLLQNVGSFPPLFETSIDETQRE